MKIIVYSGQSIEKQAITEMHPISAVNYVNNLITNERLSDVIEHKIYTNNADLVMAVKYLGELHNVQTEFFLNGISHGTDIEPLFADFNRGFDLVSELYEQKPSSLIVDIETNSNKIIAVDIETNSNKIIAVDIETNSNKIIAVDNSDKILDTNVSNLDNNEG